MVTLFLRQDPLHMECHRVFINDIVESSSVFRYILYADNSTLTHSFRREESEIVHHVINQGLSDVFEWLLANRVAVNTNKT